MVYGNYRELKFQENIDVESNRIYDGSRIISPIPQGFFQRFNQSREFFQKYDLETTRNAEYIADLDNTINILKENNLLGPSPELLPNDYSSRERILSEHTEAIQSLKSQAPDEVLDLDEINQRQTDRVQELLAQRNIAENNSTVLGRFGSVTAMLTNFLSDPIGLMTFGVSAAVSPAGTLLGTLARFGVSDLILGSIGEILRAPSDISFKQRFVDPEFTPLEQAQDGAINVAQGALFGGALTTAGVALSRLYGRVRPGSMPRSQGLDDLMSVSTQITEIAEAKHPDVNIDTHFEAMMVASEDFIAGKNVDVSGISAGSPMRSIYNPTAEQVQLPTMTLDSRISDFRERINSGQYESNNFSIAREEGRVQSPREFIEEEQSFLNGLNELELCIRRNS